MWRPLLSLLDPLLMPDLLFWPVSLMLEPLMLEPLVPLAPLELVPPIVPLVLDPLLMFELPLVLEPLMFEPPFIAVVSDAGPTAPPAVAVSVVFALFFPLHAATATTAARIAMRFMKILRE